MAKCSPPQELPQWDTWWHTYLLWPMCVQLLLTIFFYLVLRRLYEHRYDNGQAFKRLIVGHVGNHQYPEVPWPGVLIFLSMAQIVSSSLAVVLWVMSTYWDDCISDFRFLHVVMAFVDLLNWSMNRLRGECTAACLWEINSLVDVFTITPTLWCALAPGTCRESGSWLSLHFLRSCSLPFCFRRIRQLGLLRSHSTGRLMLLELCLKVMAATFVMAGTIFTCEILGDPHVLRDTCVTTPNGEPISMVQMVYWIVVSITTVGYGDWVPSTTLARLFTCLFIVYGIVTVFIIQFSFSDLWSRYLEGSGSYVQWRGKKVPHVVVILGVRGRASKLTSVLSGFLQELLHPTRRYGETTQRLEELRGYAAAQFLHVTNSGFGPADIPEVSGWPNVVVFSPSLWQGAAGTDASANAAQAGTGTSEQDSTFGAFLLRLGLSREARRRIWFVVGRVTSRVDVERAAISTASLVLVLTDMDSDLPEDDDAQNIFTAMAIQQSFPRVQMRLMLVRPESKTLAVQSGLDVTCCFSGLELKAHLLVQNVRCHGMLPIVTGLFKSWDTADVEHFLLAAKQSEDPSSRSSLQSNFLRRPARPEARARNVSRKRVGALGPLTTTVSIGGPSSGLESAEVQRMTKLFREGNMQGWEEGTSGTRAWMYHYFHGLGQNMYGFQISGEFDNMTYGKAAAEIYARTGAIMVGVHTGAILICPQPEHFRGMKCGQLCFAVARHPSALDPVRQRGGGRSRSTISMVHSRLSMKAAQADTHLTSARAMGAQIKRRVDLLNPEPVGRSGRTPRVSTYAANSHSALTSPHGMGHGGGGGGGGNMRRSVIAHEQQQPTSSPTNKNRRGSTGSPGPRRSVVGGPEAPAGFFESRRSTAFEGHHGGMNRGSLAESEPQMDRATSLTVDRYRTSILTHSEASCSLNELRASLVRNDELVVVIVCNGEVWQQVKAILEGLLAPYQPVQRPVSLVVPTAPHSNFLKDYANHRVAITVGSCLSAEVLVEAGVLDARAVVVIPGHNPHESRLRESFFRDYQVVLCSQELECWCGVSPKEIFTCFELQESRSVNHLPLDVTRKRVDVQRAIEEISDSSGDEAVSSTAGAYMTRACSNPDTADEVMASLPIGMKESILFNPRFAAGQVFSPELFGTMLGCMFYMPFIIELVEALLMPHQRHQHAFLWQICVPPAYRSKTFGELFQDMSTGAWLEDGMEESMQEGTPTRAPSGWSEGFGGFAEHMHEQQTIPEAPMVGTVVPLAIYRYREDGMDFNQARGTGSRNYSILAPMSDILLQDQDWIIVLGSQCFGAKAQAMRLLRGTFNSW